MTPNPTPSPATTPTRAATPAAALPPVRWTGGLLAGDEPDPVGHVHERGTSDFLILCDHAGARVPRRLDALGLPESELARHIAFDPGALDTCRALADALDAELLYQRYSRLVIDCNRPVHETEAFLARSDGTPVPGNASLSATEAAMRVAEIFHPYHAAIERAIERRARRGQETVVVAMHSFTPVHGERPGPRPWDIGVLFGHDERLARPLIAQLEAEGDLIVGINEPYAVEASGDYAVPVHGERRGLAHVEIELRQDRIATAEDCRRWGARLARVLPTSLARLHAAEAEREPRRTPLGEPSS